MPRVQTRRSHARAGEKYKKGALANVAGEAIMEGISLKDCGVSGGLPLASPRGNVE